VSFFMKRHKASRTAEYMAYFRALESARPASRRMFYDPFAPHFLSPVLRGAVAIARVPAFAPLVDAYTDFRLPGARTSAIARTKLIDDVLLDALRDGISQVVILGAGFDCRAYRLPKLESAAVFEVDHPATHATKLACLQRVLTKFPENVHHVEIDFLRQTLPDVLAESGFQLSVPTVFLWEGVTQYLTREAVDAVLGYVASCCAGTRLVFTYVHAGMLDGSVSFRAATRLLRGYAGLGEPWTFGLRPKEIAGFLKERGLCLERDLAAAGYRQLCYGIEAAGLLGYEFYHVAVARVFSRHITTKAEFTG
jgi:methyltransferase (TIGR00027 family)